MNLIQQVSILGAGNMGTALAQVLASEGRSVSVWDHFPDVLEDIRDRRENRRFLPKISLHPGIRTCTTSVECVRGGELVILCVPSQFASATLAPLSSALKPDAILLNVAKGFAPDTRLIMPSLLEQLAPGHDCAHLAGPAIANEYVRGKTASVVVACRSEPAAERAAACLAGPALQPYVSTDVTGAALGGVLKNVYAILLGCLEELGGESRNLESAAITAAVAEMATIADAHGGERSTLFGLAGLGDLIATGFSPDSHNRSFGRALARGRTASELEREQGWLPEGARATADALALAAEKGITAPLAKWVAKSLAGDPPSLDGLRSALRAAGERDTFDTISK